MGYVIQISNYFEPHKHSKEEVTGLTVLEYLKSKDLNWNQFEIPTLIQFNGRALMQVEYCQVIGEGDIVTITPLLGDFVTIAYVLIAAVAATALTLAFAPQPPKIGREGDVDPTFSLKGQTNANKLGKPVPCSFGYVKNWPDYGARPYNVTIGNEQFQFSLFEVGQGYLEITEAKLDDTPIENFSDVTIEIYHPGETVTLFRDAVLSVTEIANIQLYGPDHEFYEVGGYGPFIVNDVGTQIDRIEIDINFPQGLYFVGSEGKIKSRSVEWKVEYQEIDNSDVPVGAWITLIDKTTTYATRVAQRETFGIDVTLGRYQLRAFRVTPDTDNTKVIDQIYLEAARGFLPNTGSYPGKTMIAMKAKASNSLNDQTKYSFNCRQQRHLPVYDIETLAPSALVATRSPIDAVIEILISPYGGNLPLETLDLENLYELKTEMIEAGDNFDFIFENRSNVMDAVRLALSVGQAIPVLVGSLLGAVRDRLEVIPSAVYTPRNMIAGSFEWSIDFHKLNDPDGLEVKFIDETTWKPRTLLCTIDGEAGTRPETLELTGITNADKAYQDGLKKRASVLMKRQRYSFATGLEGHLASLNALVKLSHDLPRWGKSGCVKSYSGNTVVLDQTITMELGKIYLISFNTRRGESTQNYTVIYNPEPSNSITVADVWDSSELQRWPDEERPSYVFGEENNEGVLARIVSIKPGSDETIKIECVNDDPRIYDFADAVAPGLGAGSGLVEIELPVVLSINVNPVIGSPEFVHVSWPPAKGAVSYIVEISYDGDTFERIETLNTSYIFEVEKSDTVTIRVAGVNTGVGPFQTWTGTTGLQTEPPLPVEGITLNGAFIGVALRVTWPVALSATSYIVSVRRTDDELLRQVEISSTLFEYTYLMHEEDAVGDFDREFKIEVTSKNEAGETDPVESLTASNPIPAALTGIGATTSSENNYSANIRIDWDANGDSDVKEYVVHGSPDVGFLTAPENIVYKGPAEFAVVNVPKQGSASTYYYRVTVHDVWRPEATTMSTERSIEVSAAI